MFIFTISITAGHEFEDRFVTSLANLNQCIFVILSNKFAVYRKLSISLGIEVNRDDKTHDDHEVCVTGIQSREIAVSERLFQHGFAMFKGLTEYRAGVVVTTTAGEYGVSFLDFELNTAPADGSCSASPLVGVSMQTLFTVSCTDWNDIDEVFTYQFFSKTISQVSVVVTLTSLRCNS